MRLESGKRGRFVVVRGSQSLHGIEPLLRIVVEKYCGVKKLLAEGAFVSEVSRSDLTQVTSNKRLGVVEVPIGIKYASPVEDLNQRVCSQSFS